MPNTITANSPMTRETCEIARQILRDRYVNHEIDATLYASLSEDIARIESRLRARPTRNYR